MTQVAGPDFLALQLRDLDRAASFYEHEIGLRRRGVPILMDPFDTPFGTTFVFQDPDGYAIAMHGGD